MLRRDEGAESSGESGLLTGGVMNGAATSLFRIRRSGTQLERAAADRATMPRTLLLRLAARLAASPLPLLDAVRLDLERELADLLAATLRDHLRPVVHVHHDARGDADTFIPN